MSLPRRPLEKGIRVGNMVLQADVPNRRNKGRWKCDACGARRRIAIEPLKQHSKRIPEAGGCLECARRLGIVRGKGVVPVAEGDRFGNVAAAESSPNSTTVTRFVCLTCNAERRAKPTILNTEIKNGGTGCLACDRAAGRRAISDQHRETIRRYQAEMREAPSAPRIRGRQCDHEKELVCVDPGGVEIRRCRECEETDEVPWQPPRVSILTSHYAGYGEDEDNPGFENAVRAIEDSVGVDIYPD